MSAAASSSNTAEKPAKVAEPLREDDAQPTLGVLEEDDEFEEFAVAGMLVMKPLAKKIMEYLSDRFQQ